LLRRTRCDGAKHAPDNAGNAAQAKDAAPPKRIEWVAEHLAFDIASQSQLQLADILLNTQATGEGLHDRLLERA